ncbi:MAG: hypothetical protein U0841_33830 [Chloroflexia bacterium]
MQVMQSAPTFVGTDEEQALVGQIFALAQFQARFFSARAPIRLKQDDLVGFIATQRKVADGDRAGLAAQIDAALSQNPAVFAREETDDGVVSYATTRGGTAPTAVVEDTAHSLAHRFMTVIEQLPPPPPAPKRTAPLIAEGWAQRPVFTELAGDGLDEVIAEPAPVAEAPEAAPVDVVVEEPALDIVAETIPVIEPASSPAPIMEEPPTLAELSSDDLRAALAAALEADDRFVSFGDRYFSEDMVDRYSRGDLRRIREYIVEIGEPLADEQLLQEVFNRRPNDPTYEAARFSINYRLSREKREYEFVGTRDARLWSTPGLAPIGTTLRKASELGTDYRYLLDEPAEAVGESVSHTLTFFEWAYGLLPLDGTLGQLFPQPYLEDQKTAMIRFQVPQLYVTFLTELRYATGNRGGYLVGFDEFYRENLVPGATFAIERVPNNDGEYVIRYATIGTRELRTLQIDERRNRYVFRPQSLQVQTDDSWLLTETRFPRLANLKPLDDRERRRTDAVVGAAFERAAENVGTKSEPRYWSSPEELLPVLNIERPFSLRALREVLESPQYPQFSADPETPGTFYYEPPAKKAAPAGGKRRNARAEEEEEELEDEE